MSNAEIIRSLKEAMSAKQTPTAYDSSAVVTRIEDGTAWVKIAGSDAETPVKLTIDAKAGDTVQVRVGGGSAWLTGNQSAPPTDDTTAIISKLLAQEADTKAVTAGKAADEAKEEIKAVAADLVVARELIAEKATIEDLNAERARIDTLDASKANVTDLNAATGRIGQLEANALTADSATIKDLQANKANVSDLTAATGRIGQLEADHVSTADLEAVQADIDNLEATKADVAVLEADYAKIDLANVNTAQITNGVIQTAAIVDEQVFTVTGNKATIKEINADNINVRNLNAKNLKIETADGYITIGDKKTPTKEFIDSLTNELNDRIDGAIETFTATAVPTLSNYPASDWETAEERATHVGDVCYVVNDQIAQNGYCYRFTLNGSTFSWQLIKDSDVTAALQRLQTAEGKIGDIEQFDEEIATFRTETEGEISTLQTKTSTLETSLGDKVDKTTFNEVSQKVDENSASITTLETNVAKKADSSTVTTLSNTVNNVSQKADSNEAAISDLTEVVESKADGSTVSTLTQTVNSVKQTADGNSSTITSLTTTLGTNADGTTKAGDIVHRTSAVEQDLSGFKTTVASTYHKTSDFNTYKTANDSAVAEAKKAGTDAQSSLDSYKTTNDAAVATAKKAGDDAQADLDAYKGTVSETYATKSALTQTESSIKAEVASTYTTQTTFNNYKTSNDSAVAGVKTTADAAKEAIDGLDIGGRNLLKDTKSERTSPASANKSAYVSPYYMLTSYGDLALDNTDDYYTYSFDYEVDGNSAADAFIYVQIRGSAVDSQYHGAYEYVIDAPVGRYSAHFKLTSAQATVGDSVYCPIRLRNATDGAVLIVKNVKLERGNRATDWTPAPEDLEAATTAVASDLETVKTTYVTNSTFETTTEQIRGEVSAAETTAKNYTDGKIATEVSDRNSAITQKADEITSSVSATYATKTSVPTKVSQLTNDSKYATQTEAQGYASTAESNAKADTTNKLKSYSTTSQMNTAISQSASSIEAKITASETASKEYADGLIEDEVTARDAAIQASADSITSTVSETYATKSSVPTKTSDLTNDSEYATTTQAQGYANTAESNAKADTTEKLKSYSTTAQVTSAINQKAGEITQTVSETYQTKADMDDYSTTTEMNSAIDQKADAITASVAETYTTKTDFNALEIGGRNLFKNSGTFASYWSLDNSTVSDGVATINGAASGNKRIYQMPANGYWGRWEANTSYVLSVEAKADVDGMTMSLEPYANAVGVKSVSLTTEWKRYSYAFKSGSSTSASSCTLRNTGSENIYLRKPKLELGTKATDWTPAPEDLEAYADTAVATAKSEIKVTTDGISTEVAKKVGNSEIISKINQSAETVKIQASKVEVDGTLIIGKSTAESVAQTAVDGVTVGGRNLYAFKDSNLPISFGGVNWTVEDDGWIKGAGTWNRSAVSICNFWGNMTSDKFPAGDYTLTVENDGLLETGKIEIQLSYYDTTSGTGNHMLYIVEGSNTVTVKGYISRVCPLVRAGNSGMQVNGRFRFKLEKGTKSTDWSPAPEDVDAGIASAAQTASKYITADSTSGIKVHAEANPTTNYAQIDDTGMSIYQGVDGVATEVAEFKASGVRIGQEDKANVNVTPNSVEINAYTGSNAVTITCESASDYTGEIDYGIKITDEHNQSAIRILPTVIEDEAFDGTLELTSLMARYAFDCNGGMYMYCGGGGFSVGGPTKEFFCVDEGGQITVNYQQPPILYEDVAEIVSYSAGTIGTKGASVSLGTTVKTGYTYLGAVVLRHQNAGNFWISFSRNTSNNNVYADCYRANASAVNGMAITIRKMWASTKITGIPE